MIISQKVSSKTSHQVLQTLMATIPNPRGDHEKLQTKPTD